MALSVPSDDQLTASIFPPPLVRVSAVLLLLGGLVLTWFSALSLLKLDDRADLLRMALGGSVLIGVLAVVSAYFVADARTLGVLAALPLTLLMGAGSLCVFAAGFVFAGVVCAALALADAILLVLCIGPTRSVAAARAELKRELGDD